jgi:hypothetical protein
MKRIATAPELRHHIFDKFTFFYWAGRHHSARYHPAALQSDRRFFSKSEAIRVGSPCRPKEGEAIRVGTGENLEVAPGPGAGPGVTEA